jgi:hypothetical protein
VGAAPKGLLASLALGTVFVEALYVSVELAAISCGLVLVSMTIVEDAMLVGDGEFELVKE